MKNGSAELVFIIDRSGSMSGLEDDTIGGFNTMLKEQQAVEGEAVVTTVLFDDQYELLHDRINIQAIAPLTREDYTVGGSTALLDAIGMTIHKIRKAQRPNVINLMGNHEAMAIDALSGMLCAVRHNGELVSGEEEAETVELWFYNGGELFCPICQEHSY